jgi:hypothetical protein
VIEPIRTTTESTDQGVEHGRLAANQQAHEKQMKIDPRLLPELPTIDLIVTRNPHLHAFLVELGLAKPDTPVLERATTKDVRRKHVIGTLPHHLSALAATFTEIPLRLSCADREQMREAGLTVERLHEIAGEPAVYKVIDTHRRHPGLAWHGAYEYTYGFGGPSWIWKQQTWCGLDTYVLIDGTEQLAAEVLPDRGVWRPLGTTRWIDGFGQVAEQVEPAPHWGYRLRPAGCIEESHPNVETAFPESYRWTIQQRRWETVDEAIAACPSLGLDGTVEVVKGSEHGWPAIVYGTWKSPAEMTPYERALWNMKDSTPHPI